MGSLVPDAGGRWRSMWTQTSKKNRKISIFFGRLPRVLPARENRISTQGAVRKILRKIICPYGACLVCFARSEHSASEVGGSIPGDRKKFFQLFRFRLCPCLAGDPVIKLFSQLNPAHRGRAKFPRIVDLARITASSATAPAELKFWVVMADLLAIC